MSDSSSTWPDGRSASEAPAATPDTPHFQRSVGLFPAIAVNMIQICGIGPFITIPAIVAVMNGPLAVIGWVVGALLAMADGLHATVRDRKARGQTAHGLAFQELFGGQTRRHRVIRQARLP